MYSWSVLSLITVKIPLKQEKPWTLLSHHIKSQEHSIKSHKSHQHSIPCRLFRNKILIFCGHSPPMETRYTSPRWLPSNVCAATMAWLASRWSAISFKAWPSWTQVLVIVVKNGVFYERFLWTKNTFVYLQKCGIHLITMIVLTIDDSNYGFNSPKNRWE